MGNRNGLTLVEVVFATAILAIFLLGIFTTITVSQQQETFTREHQAVSEAIFKQLDTISVQPIDTIAAGQRDGSDVPAYAFHVQYKGQDLQPASAGFEALNASPNADRAGHVRVRQVLDLDGDPLTPAALADWDNDGDADVIELDVVVAWRSAILGDQRLAVTTRKFR